MKKKYFETHQNPVTVALETLPMIDYAEFCSMVSDFSVSEKHHLSSYFAFPKGDDELQYFCVFADNENKSLIVLSHIGMLKNASLDSLTKTCNAFHIFEREIHEQYGVAFPGHPWLKPVRYPHNGFDSTLKSDDYPFFSIDSEELHEVGVGPVHAGVIEPGHFRFICSGEKVRHLEIHLGYQHRGVERLMVEKKSQLQKSILCESIAGDTVVGHSLGYVQLMESLAEIQVSEKLQLERVIALELERIAVHIGDTAALCGDVAFQLGQVVCESLRTLVINTTQFWCGNRFGKGLIRAGGSNYFLTEEVIEYIQNTLSIIDKRYNEIATHIFSMPGVLTRFDGIGVVTREQGLLAGLKGMSARMCGIKRDLRHTHPSLAYAQLDVKPIVFPNGDVLARALVRRGEINSSMEIIAKAILLWSEHKVELQRPDYQIELQPNSICFSLVEGWRGEIAHAALTDDSGSINHYKVVDPSMHNWMGLALAVRNQEISDFPVCNKSFNLSYCGFDL